MFDDTFTGVEGAGNAGSAWRSVVLLGVLPAVIVAVPAAAIAKYRGSVPSRLATHWSGSEPDGSMTLTGLIVTVSLVLILPGLAALVGGVLASRRLPQGMASMVAFTGLFIAGLGAWILTWSVFSHRNLESWTEASSVGVFPGVIASIGIGAAAAWLARTLPGAPDSPQREGDQLPALELASAERAVFVETMTFPFIMGLAAVGLLAAGVMLFIGEWQTGLFCLLMTLPGLSMGRVRVQADRNGVTLRSTLLPIRYNKIDLADIEQASVIDVEPMKWGGWGYRGSLKIAGTAAFVTRKGPGLRLDLTKNRRFAVTINDPETPTRLLNALRANA